ncbi:Zinc/iron permease [Coemansia mojavensis]|nr:Zinc/iron permease [Coemansia mojavensis]
MASDLECIRAEGVSGWDRTAHIIALFAIFGASAIGVFLPIVGQTIRGLNQMSIPVFPIQLGQFFGAGIIIATAFLHLLPAANDALTNTCLAGFADRYGAWACVIALAAVMSMHSIDIYANHNGQYPIENSHGTSDSTTAHSRNMSASSILTFPAEVKQRALATYILELGIAMYSVLIGLALAISDSGFIAMFIAICFHQFFEGMALGTSLAELYWIKAQLAQHQDHALAFCITTPTGIIIGLALHNIYEPHSQYALLLNGVLQSICTGVLIYAGLVTLIIGGFSSSAVKQLPRLMQLLLFVAVYAGAAVMAGLKVWK